MALFCGLALPRCSQPPAVPDTAADEARLKADALIWFDHFAKGDADAVANLYAEDALLMPPGAPAVTGRAGIKTFLGEEAAKTKAAGLSLNNNAVTGAGVHGDSGWISGTYVVVDGSGATLDSGSYLSVHRRTNGAWRHPRYLEFGSAAPPAPMPADKKK
jgi:ketosteroid isomerase-like protein